MNVNAFFIVIVCMKCIIAFDFTPKFSIPRTEDTYGPYISTLESVKVCNGPKRTNLSNPSLSLIGNRSSYMLVVNITYFQNIRFEEVRLMISSYTHDKKVLLWNEKLKDPCKHFAFAEIIRKQYGTKGCTIEKGSYYHKLNLTYITYEFIGDSFFYGRFATKTTIMSKLGNILCVQSVVLYEKATKNS